MPPRCPHGRLRYYCKECGGSGLCEHGRQRSRCKDCGGGGLCEHGRRRSLCKECGGSRQDAVILEATAVEVNGVDEDAEPDEWIPTVQSYIVVAAGARGGKRKRSRASTVNQVRVRRHVKYAGMASSGCALCEVLESSVCPPAALAPR